MAWKVHIAAGGPTGPALQQQRRFPCPSPGHAAEPLAVSRVPAGSSCPREGRKGFLSVVFQLGKHFGRGGLHGVPPPGGEAEAIPGPRIHRPLEGIVGPVGNFCFQGERARLRKGRFILRRRMDYGCLRLSVRPLASGSSSARNGDMSARPALEPTQAALDTHSTCLALV
jgi:hypothetical protein